MQSPQASFADVPPPSPLCHFFKQLEVRLLSERTVLNTAQSENKSNNNETYPNLLKVQ